MKSTGIVRKIDNEGRLTLPKELRKSLGLTSSDFIEIYTKDNSIVIQKLKNKIIYNLI